MPIETGVYLLPGADRVAIAHQQAGQQPDNLCGPYWVAILLNAYANLALHPAQVGQKAGSILPIGEVYQWLPPDTESRQDYTVALPTTQNLPEAGTSAQGLVVAVDELSQGQYCLVPITTFWNADAVTALIHLCQAHPEWQAVPLCNIATGYLWGSRLGLTEAIAHLYGETVTPPAPDWQVGHFVTLAGIVSGAARSLLIVRDTYPRFGWDGYHLQPPEVLARALQRDDPIQGGMLLFAASSDRPDIEQEAKAAGFTIALWNNGTPS